MHLSFLTMQVKMRTSFNEVPNGLWKDHFMLGHLSSLVERTALQTIPLAQPEERKSIAWE